MGRVQCGGLFRQQQAGPRLVALHDAVVGVEYRNGEGVVLEQMVLQVQGAFQVPLALGQRLVHLDKSVGQFADLVSARYGCSDEGIAVPAATHGVRKRDERRDDRTARQAAQNQGP